MHAPLPLRFPLFLAGGILLLVPPAAFGQSEAPAPAHRSSWECLPDQTTLAVRIPRGRAVLNELKATTKLGSIILDDDRVKRIHELMSSHEAWEKLETKLAEYGLSPNDLPQLLSGETGFALVLDHDRSRRGEGAPPLPLGLAWVEPGPELAQRLVDAIQKEVEDRAGDDPPVTRVDFDMAGHSVMLLTVPQVDEVYGDRAFELPEDFDELSREQRREAIRRASEKAEAGKKTRTQYHHVLLTSRQGRLLLATTLEPTEDSEAKLRVDRLTNVFDQFLSAHTGDPGSFVSRVESTPGMREALPQEGVVFVELLGDIAPVLNLIVDQDPEAVDDADQMAMEVMRSMGVDQLGAVALRSSLVNSVVRTGIFVEAPSPRTGILSALDQRPLDPEPAPWVPASVMEYGHFSLDVGKLYAQIKAIVIQGIGEDAERQFERVEAGIQGVAQTDLTAILSSLGQQHVVLNLEPKFQEVEVSVGEPVVAPRDRIALVWKVTDETVFQRLFQAGQAFVGLAQGAVEFGEEQGFRGYRLTSKLVEGGLFLGKGYLVLAIGEEVLEQTLSALNHPPSGKDALRNSDVFARGAELLPLQPGLSFELSDNSRYAGMMDQALDSLLQSSAPLAEQDDEFQDFRDLLKQLRQIMPTGDELDNVFGVAVGYARATDRGLEIKTASELPAP